MIQGSEEWRYARVGSLGASCVHEVVARTKTGPSASRANRMAALIVERLTGEPQDTYQSAAMAHGTETEPQARAAYEFMRNVDVDLVGLIQHPTIAGTHACPDGLIGTDGVLEIKCPQSAAHIETLLTGKVPDKYVVQCQWQLECSERAWADFVSFDPKMPAGMRLFVKRVERDDARIAELKAAVTEFLAELAGRVADLRRIYSLPEPEAQTRRWEDLKLAMRAGIKCADPAFQKWLGAVSEADAAYIVRERCGIGSRRDLDSDQRAAEAWGVMEAEFWMATRGYEAA